MEILLQYFFQCILFGLVNISKNSRDSKLTKIFLNLGISAMYLVSCEEVRMLNPTLTFKETIIDIDDAGPLEPFAVRCSFQRKYEMTRWALPYQFGVIS